MEHRIYHFEEMDSFGEVLKEMQILRNQVLENNQEIEELNRKIDLGKPKKAVKPKRSRGFVMRNTLIAIVAVSVVIGLLFSSVVYAQYVRDDINYDIASNPDSLATFLDDVLNTGNFLFDPTATAPDTDEGRVYYDSGTNAWLGYNGTSWQTFDVAGGVSLDGGYDFGGAGSGRTINATDGAVQITNTENDTASLLGLTYSGNTTGDGLTITMSVGSGDAIEIENTGTGYDIEGTGGLWYVTKAGVATFASMTFDSITLENSETIGNSTDTEFVFTDSGSSEDIILDMDAGTNAVGLKSSSGVDELAMGTVDDLTGVGTIVFDASASSISLAADGTDDNLTLTVTGAQASSVIITSEGTGLDAIDINTSAGGIDMDTTDDFNLTVTSSTDGEDLLLTQTGTHDASIVATSAGTGLDAIKLETTNASGDIWIDSGDTINIDAADDIDIDLAGASGEDFMVTNTGGSILLSASEDATDAIDIDATAGGIDVDAVGAAGQDIVVTNTGGSINLSASEDAVDAINIDATAGGIDIDATGASGQDITVTNTGGSILLATTESAVDSIKLQSTLGGIQIYCDAAAATEDIDIKNTGGSVNLTSSEAADLAIYLYTSNAAGQIAINSTDATADGIEIDSAGGIEIDCAGTGEDIRIDSAAGSVYVEGAEAAATAITIDASNVAGGMDMDCGSGGFNLTATAGDITLQNTTAKDIILDASAGRVLITGTESAADSVILTADGANGEITLAANAGGIDIDGTGGIISLDTSGAGIDVDLDATAGAVSIDGGETGAVAVVIIASHADGGIDVDAGTNGMNFKATGGDIKLENTAAKDIVLDATAGRVLITGTESAADAIALVADGANGEISISAAIGGVDIDAASGDITVDVAGAATDEIKLTNTNGTAAGAIALLASAGGISAEVADEKAIYIGNDAATTFVKVSPSATPATELIAITNEAGTADTAIALTATAGGITAKVADGKNLILGNAASDAHVTVAAHGTAGSEDVRIVNTNGTDAKAIEILASAGGIGIECADTKEVYMGSDAADTYVKVAPHGTAATEIISVVNAAGTAAGAIVITSTSGGVDINTKEMFTVDVAAGTAGTADITLTNSVGTDNAAIAITTTTGGIDINAKEMLTLDVAAGTAGTADIIITNTPGTDAAAIYLNAVAGGMKLHVVDEKALVMGHIGDDTYVSISPSATPATELIKILNTAGTAVAEDGAAIQLSSLAGGISIQSDGNLDDAITIRADGGTTAEMLIHNDRGTSVTSIEIVSDDGGISVTSTKALKLETALCLNDVQTISQDDATPDVSGYSFFNTGTNADTIDDFDGTNIEEGQIIVVVSKAAITYDVDAGALVCGTTDLVTASGDVTLWIYDGTNWVLLSWMDDAADQNGKG